MVLAMALAYLSILPRAMIWFFKLGAQNIAACGKQGKQH